MIIGVDYNGMVADTRKVSAQIAREFFNCRVDPQDFKRSKVVGKGLTNDQYDFVKREVYNNWEYLTQVEPLAGALDGLSSLQKQGHILNIISNKTQAEREIMLQWLHHNGQNLDLEQIELAVVDIGKSKFEEVKNLDIYIDNEVAKLQQIIQGAVFRMPHLIHFNTDNHQSISRSEWLELFGIPTIGSWPELNRFLNQIL